MYMKKGHTPRLENSEEQEKQVTNPGYNTHPKPKDAPASYEEIGPKPYELAVPRRAELDRSAGDPVACKLVKPPAECEVQRSPIAYEVPVPSWKSGSNELLEDSSLYDDIVISPH